MVGIGARHRLASAEAAVRIRQGQGLASVRNQPLKSMRRWPQRTRQTAPCAAARAGATGASPSNPRDRTRPRSCSPPASQRPDRDAAARPAPSPDPNSDAPAEPTGTRQSPPTTTAHAGAAPASGPKAPKHRPADSRKPLVTDPTAHTPTTGRGKRFLTRLNRHHKTQAQVSFQTIGKLLLADHQTCYPCLRFQRYLCIRFAPLTQPLPEGEGIFPCSRLRIPPPSLARGSLPRTPIRGPGWEARKNIAAGVEIGLYSPYVLFGHWKESPTAGAGRPLAVPGPWARAAGTEQRGRARSESKRATQKNVRGYSPFRRPLLAGAWA